MQPRCYWLSDLHLFSRRSLADQYFADIAAVARRADVVILGGDIFDFSWSTYDTVDDSVAAAVDWLRELVAQAPDCQFHFVLGNHDHHRRFVARLETIQLELPNLQWHPYFLRIGDTMFLHGDAADVGSSGHTLESRRSRWLDASPKRLMWHRLYDVAVAARLHRVTSQLVYRDRRVVRRLLEYLEAIGNGRQTGLRHVYFGHTHVPMSHYEFLGVRFHNGGAPLKGLRFEILEPALGSVEDSPELFANPK